MAHTGTVKWFNEDKGYGFIAIDDGGADVFVAATVIQGESKTLVENQRVELELTQGTKGPQAEKVQAL
ncbi:cold-shock protein [Streptomyces lavendulae]|uniref:cold-shock protein n=1 Tax=Streptomyces lavendulae TaxID=1914 RepID=UPI0037FAE525